MCCFLTGDTDISTSLLPLGTVRLDTSISIPLVGHQMRQLMQHRPANFFLGNIRQTRIQLNQGRWPGRAPSTRAHPSIPAHAHPLGQIIQTHFKQELGAGLGETCIHPHQMRATLRNTRLILLFLQKSKLDLAGGTKHGVDYYGILKYFKNLNKKKFPLVPHPMPLNPPYHRCHLNLTSSRSL